MRHCVVNLGCKVNRVESDGFERLLRKAGSVAATAAEADLIVVNTCTVTAEADKKTRKAVRQALRANGHAQVIVTGCAAALAPGAFEALGARVSAVGKAEMEAVLAAAVERAGGGRASGLLGAEKGGRGIGSGVPTSPQPLPLSSAEASSENVLSSFAGAGGAGRGIGSEVPPRSAAEQVPSGATSPQPLPTPPAEACEEVRSASFSIEASDGMSRSGSLGVEGDRPPLGGEEGEVSLLPFGRARVGVKVQDGCDNACTYCIVHVARGPARSRPADAVVAEACALVRAGVREVVLTGINLGSYRDGSLGLAGLLQHLLAATADLHGPGELPCRFRLSSIEPADVGEDLMEALASAEGRLCRHLHLPLQSGSSRVLADMARPYSAEDYVALVGRLRAWLPSLALATDVIAGFPGETEGDFEQTCAVARACGFMNLHVFPYSQREGTPAAARPDQLASEVRADRAARLRVLGAELRAADRAARVGTRELGLVEAPGRAMTESYYEVTVGDSAPVGALVGLTLS